MKRKQYLNDLEIKSVKELVAERGDLQKKLFTLKMQHATTGVKKNSDITSLRKNIARVCTILSRKIKTLYGSSMK